MVEHRVKKPEEQEKSIQAAKDALLSQQDNLLMRSWEYTVATCVEKLPEKHSVHDYMVAAYASEAKKYMDDLIIESGLEKELELKLMDMSKLIADTFRNLLKEKTETRYDPSVKNKQEYMTDGYSSSGGYSMFIDNKKIESNSDFQAAMERLLMEVEDKTDSQLDEEQKKEGDFFFDWLSKEFGRSSFQKKIIKKACGYTQKDENKMANPWTLSQGGNMESLLQVYSDSSEPLKIEVCKPGKEGAEKLAKLLFDKMKKMGVDKKLSPDHSWEESSMPVYTSGIHGFNLLPSRPGTAMILKGYDNPQEGIDAFKKNEIIKNQQRSNQELSLKPMDPILNNLIEQAVSVFEPDKIKAARLQVTQKFTGKTIKLKDFTKILNDAIEGAIHTAYSQSGTHGITEMDELAKASKKCVANSQEQYMLSFVPKQEYEALIGICLERLKVPKEKQSDISQEILKTLKNEKIDSIKHDDLKKFVKKAIDKVNKSLKEEEKIKYEDESILTALQYPSGLVFADTNWGHGDHRRLMSMVVNPLTNEMELWLMNEDGSNPSKMDQDKWVKKPKWVIFGKPDEYGGITGDPEWEEARKNVRTQLESCNKQKVGNIFLMQSALEIADDHYKAGKKKKGKKTLNKLLELTKESLQLSKNRKEAVLGINEILKEIEKISHKDTATAKETLNRLIKAIEAISNNEDRNRVLSQHSTLCNLLKTAQDPLGISIDVDTVLKKVA